MARVGLSLALVAPDPLYRRLRQHADRNLPDPESAQVGKLVPAFKQFLKLENEMLLRYHRKGDSGLRVALARAAVIDVVVERLYTIALAHHAREHGSVDTPIAILATGGYGRAELSPHSDIDILFLFPDNVKEPVLKPLQQTLTDVILYTLWDLNMKVGYATRTIREALDEAHAEINSKNAMLESRFLCGSRTLSDRFADTYVGFARKDRPQEYIEARLADQIDRRKKFGDTVFLQEPDIKNGVGGLRDYQNILWMARIKLNKRSVDELLEGGLLRKNEHRDFVAAYDFLLRTRNELHFQSKRPTDLLDLERQPRIAWNLGYKQHRILPRVEAFMRDYYTNAQTIYQTSLVLEQRLALTNKTRISFRDVIRARRFQHKQTVDGFELTSGTLTASGPRVFVLDPVRLIRIFRHAQHFEASLDFDLECLIRDSLDLIDATLIQSPEANAAFRSILQSPGSVYPILLKMHELRVLPRFLPEWSGLYCLVQHEYYHRYTADIHTLNTIRELDAIFNEEEPRLTGQYERAVRGTQNPSLLYLILLLHDIGKAHGVQGHAERGAEMAVTILQRLGIPADLHDKIRYIITNHLEMARFWQKHDIEDADAIEQFADQIGDEERLRLLFVHTFCDARGTTVGLWNSYKDSLHRTLYHSTLAHLRAEPGLRRRARPMINRDNIVAALPELSEDEIEAHFNLLPERYFVHATEAEVTLHLQMVNSLLLRIAEADSVGSLVPIVDWRDDLNLGMTVVNVVTWDRAGLFCKLAGAFSVAGLNILSSKAITRADHITIDTFYVTEPNGGIVQHKQAREVFESHLRDALLYNRDMMPEILRQSREKSRPTYLRRDRTLRAPIDAHVEVYEELDLRRTIIEIEANDQIGILYRIARAIYDHGYDISFARISTERGALVDTFYIDPINKADRNGQAKLRLRDLQRSLNALIAPAAEEEDAV